MLAAVITLTVPELAATMSSCPSPSMSPSRTADADPGKDVGTESPPAAVPKNTSTRPAATITSPRPSPLTSPIVTS